MQPHHAPRVGSSSGTGRILQPLFTKAANSRWGSSSHLLQCCQGSSRSQIQPSRLCSAQYWWSIFHELVCAQGFSGAPLPLLCLALTVLAPARWQTWLQLSHLLWESATGLRQTEALASGNCGTLYLSGKRAQGKGDKQLGQWRLVLFYTLTHWEAPPRLTNHPRAGGAGGLQTTLDQTTARGLCLRMQVQYRQRKQQPKSATYLLWTPDIFTLRTLGLTGRAAPCLKSSSVIS